MRCLLEQVSRGGSQVPRSGRTEQPTTADRVAAGCWRGEDEETTARLQRETAEVSVIPQLRISNKYGSLT
jgi:hypothetical protein